MESNALERSIVIDAMCILESRLVVISSHVLSRAVVHECPFKKPDKLSPCKDMKIEEIIQLVEENSFGYF